MITCAENLIDSVKLARHDQIQYDSEAGEALARVIDRSEARHTGGLSLSNSVTSMDEARSTVSDWARILRNGLDKAHGIGRSGVALASV